MNNKANLILILLLLSVVFCVRFVPSENWETFAEDFEEGDWKDNFNQVDNENNIQRTQASSQTGSWGITMGFQDGTDVSRHAITDYDTHYVKFGFNANSAQFSGFDVVQLIKLCNENWASLVSLYIVPKEGDSGMYQLTFNHGNTDDNIDFTDGWHTITIGLKFGEWEAVWIDGEEDSSLTNFDVDHQGTKYKQFYLGVNWVGGSPSGSFLYDNVYIYYPKFESIYVDCDNGNDDNDGTTEEAPLKTLSSAANLITPGGTVYVLPSVCRGPIVPRFSGEANKDDPDKIDWITYKARDGAGTASIRGSQAFEQSQWKQATTSDLPDVSSSDVSKIYYVDLSSYELEESPVWVVDPRTDAETSYSPDGYHQARFPNWGITTSYKWAKNWATGDGATQTETCDPATEGSHCDHMEKRKLHDEENFGSSGVCSSLVGGTLRAVDGYQGYYFCKRKIVSHSTSSKTIEVDKDCLHDWSAGLGRWTRYYIEGLSCLLDQAGEWWYDVDGTKRLYVWPKNGQEDLPHLEISVIKDDPAWKFVDKRYLKIEDFKIQYWNKQGMLFHQYEGKSIHNINLTNLDFSFTDTGLELAAGHNSDPYEDDEWIQDINIYNNKFQWIAGHCMSVHEWWSNAPSNSDYQRPQIRNVLIDHNAFRGCAFYCNEACNDKANGVVLQHPNEIQFTYNHISTVAHNGLKLSYSINKNDQVQTKHTLVYKNIVEKACMVHTDCACLKVGGSAPERHIFYQTLIMRNIFAKTIGWSLAAEKRGWWSFGTDDSQSMVQGQGGFGLYLDHATGITSWRNIFFNNAFSSFYTAGTWLDAKVHFYNNLLVGSADGITVGGDDSIGDGVPQNFYMQNNIFTRIEGMEISYGNVNDDNFYAFDWDWFVSDRSPWNEKVSYASLLNRWANGGSIRYHDVQEMQEQSDWGDNAMDQEVYYQNYDETHFDRYNDPDLPDFHLLESNTKLINKGNSDFDQDFVDILTSHQFTTGIVDDEIDFGPLEYGSNDIDPTPQPTPTPTPTPDTDPDDDGDDDKTNAKNDDNSNTNTTGIAIAIVFSLIFVAAIIFVGVSRKKNGSFSLMWLSWKLSAANTFKRK
ncbi:pectate lyase (eurofung) [Anaeramoeba flamelloides]|uniref:Pectate lyase (Eurofung) n=1 Tax=Anaeramoeba flamelloides TaxID=1746091 RepID=A0ABQ8XI54_9EUKA|nr:pectate lyase (eurofung) [Anaeramoeba flamelloides]